MLIAVTGAKGSGKDTFAAYFERRNFMVLKMADTLKNMLRQLYRDAGLDLETIERKIEGDMKEDPCRILGGQTPRWAMQSLGTEWRNLIDKNLWTRIFENRARRLLKEGVPVICTDLRFEHELEVVRALGGHVVRIERPQVSSDDNHVSETEMNRLQVDETVYNDGSIHRLHQKAEAFLNDYS